MKKGTEFTINGIRIQIDDAQDQVSEGSSCLVYHGHIHSENGIVPNRVIIKEFYPDIKRKAVDFHVVREEESGCLLVSEKIKEQTEYKMAWEQFMQGLEYQKKLAASGAMEIAVKPLVTGVYGDSYYIVSDAHLGADLKQAEPVSLREKLNAAVSLTETMGILHEEGYLMLDFKPENFLWIRRPSVVILIDTDSLVPYRDDSLAKMDRIYLNSQYISPQIRMLEKYLEEGVSEREFERMKRANLKPISDLYAIGSYLYTLFFHKTWQGGTLSDSMKEELLKDFINEYTLWEKQETKKIEETGKELIDILGRLLIEDLFDRMEKGYENAEALMQDLKAVYAGYTSKTCFTRKDIVHPDTVKLNSLLDWIKNENMAEKVEFRDGKVLLDNQEVFSLDHVPFYRLNKNVQDLRQKKEVLSKNFYKLRMKNIENPLDESVFHKLIEISGQLEKTTQQLYELEGNMLDHYNKILQMDEDGAIITERGNAAKRLLEEGNYEGAVALLNEKERTRELDAAKSMAEQGMELIKGYLSENKIKTAVLYCQGLNPERIAMLEDCFRENAELSEKYRLDYNCIYEYASFLHSTHRFTQAMDVSDKLEKIYEGDASVAKTAMADLYLLRSNLYYAFNDFHKNIWYLERAQKMCEEMKDREKLSDVYNNLGIHFANLGAAGLGVFYLRKAMELVEKKKDRGYALICGNLANCLLELAKSEQDTASRQFLLKECEQLYDQAIEIEEELNKNKQTKDLGRLSEVYYNMAFFCFEMGQTEEAVSLCRTSLAISREEVLENPHKGWISVVQRLKELAYYYDVEGDFGNSEPLYQEAIHIMGRLHEKEPEAYLEVMVHLYGNYGYMLRMTGREKESSEYMERAEDIYRQLIQRG
ncbi:MAG: hypothetical protein E7253_03555 [Lachnospiraceae bacterium]|nr:hypothetical protein [Lachnospiraceae bacterium]